MNSPSTLRAVIFDLDGVITDTAEYHYQAWQQLADEEGLPFDREINELCRGVSRRDSLMIVLGGRSETEERLQELMARKQRTYESLLDQISPADLLPGVADLLDQLDEAGVPASWAMLKGVWLSVLLVVLGANLFYWPFYLAAEDTSMRTCYANCGRFWLLHPGTAAVLLIVAVVVAITAVSWLLPVILGAVFWVAISAQTAVQRSLANVLGDKT